MKSYHKFIIKITISEKMNAKIYLNDYKLKCCIIFGIFIQHFDLQYLNCNKIIYDCISFSDLHFFLSQTVIFVLTFSIRRTFYGGYEVHNL